MTDTTGPGSGMTVGALASLMGLSVRTLHYWDEIGLVVPSRRSRAGYRLYSEEDAQRVQQVLVYRQTGLSLAEIGRVLAEPGSDAAAHLARQRELLEERICRMQAMVRAIDTMMGRRAMGQSLSAAEQAEIWDSDWGPSYAQEAEERWGGTQDWAEAARRQARMSKPDWIRAHEETEDLEADLAQAFVQGVEPGSRRANELAEHHRADLNRWFEVSVAKQVLIARRYTSDERFARHYDRRAVGLAAWLRAVVEVGARAQGVDPAAARWDSGASVGGPSGDGARADHGDGPLPPSAGRQRPI
ncbi:MerR family transcriptional regulator [Actinomyces slackii]|nr:MerR family transcriptional regulator [Actinomyces slackii]